MSKIAVHIIKERVEEFVSPDLDSTGHGSEVSFKGVIRPEEGDATIKGITFEAYEEMALKVMRELLEKLDLSYPFLAAEVVHRIGDVPVGEAAIRVSIWTKHRIEGFTACSEFMNRLKKDVPIWKVKTF